MTHIATSIAVLCFAWFVFGAQTSDSQSKLLEHMRAGIKARDEHRLEAAAREFEAAARIAPHAAEIPANLGLVRHRQGDSRAAVESFQRALQLNPKLPGIHGLLGFHLLMLGQVASAVDHLEKAEQESPSNPEVKSWLALAYFQSGRYDEAIARWEAVREREPEDASVLRYLEKARAALSGLAPDQLRPFSHRESLIRNACTQCHRWTPPGILPRGAWAGKVAKMFGLAGGMLASRNRPIELEVDEVVRFFETLAPETLDIPTWGPAKPHPKLRFERRNLRGVSPGETVPGTANVRLLELFEDVPGPEFLVCDMLSGWISWADPQDPKGQLQGLARLSHPARAEPADLDMDGQIDLLVAELGEVMPSNKKEGALLWLRRTGPRRFEIKPLVKDIGRVADVRAADFDGDGDLDIIAAEFGWITVGSILYLENRSETTGRRSAVFGPPVTLEDRSGAIHVPVVDLNKDGRPDFLALLSQEHETVTAFLNRGKGAFEKFEIFAAPHPHWGSTGIEPVDLDGDGDLDILMTNGDTMDDMIQFKPYHGVSWLENRGTYPFVHHRIGPYYGALRAVPADLDRDGDLDVVASSWLPELDEAKRRNMSLPGVIWYEQVSPGSFQVHVLSDAPCDYPTLETGDVDADGHADVIAGAAWLGTPPAGRPGFAVSIWRQIFE